MTFLLYMYQQTEVKQIRWKTRLEKEPIIITIMQLGRKFTPENCTCNFPSNTDPIKQVNTFSILHLLSWAKQIPLFVDCKIDDSADSSLGKKIILCACIHIASMPYAELI